MILMEIQTCSIKGAAMRCKVFSVPVESGPSADGERKLNDFLNSTQVKNVFASVTNHREGPVWSILFLYEGGAQPAQETLSNSSAQAKPRRETFEAPAPSGNSLTRQEVKSVIALKKWRADTAAMEGVPLYMVAQNRWLEEIVRIPVKTIDDLKKVDGFGEWRVQKYGRKIVEILGSSAGTRRSWSPDEYGTARA
jgi:superfamily II DNA helicase RecQ